MEALVTLPDLDLEKFPACLTAAASGAPGLYDAHVHLHGSMAEVRLRDALSFVRRGTGRHAGEVPYWNRVLQKWERGFELNPLD